MNEEVKPRKTHAERNAEYWLALEKWVSSVRSMTVTCNMLTGLPFPMMMGGPPLAPSMAAPPFNMPPARPMLFAYNYPNQVPNLNHLNGNIPPSEEYVDYHIPPLWKRFIAELIDFMILFFIKLAITFIAVDFFDFIDLDKYDIAVLQSDEIDYNLAWEMTTAILLVELIHRVIVCFYEGFALAQPSGEPLQLGGATPGKKFMGLRVIACSNVVQGAAEDIVRVSAADTMGVGFSFARAVLKNIVLGALLPICFPLFFNKFNRVGYDLICRCIVVEDTRVQNVRRG